MDREALLVEMVRDDGASPSTGSVILRRSAFDFVGGFDETFRDMYEDMVFYSKLSTHFPVYISSNVWSLYRKHDESSCAVAYRDGRIIKIKGRPSSPHRAFLEAVDDYYSTVDEPSALMQRTLAAALEPYRHPLRYRFRQLLFPAQLVRPLRRNMRRRTRRLRRFMQRRYRMLRSMVRSLILPVRRPDHRN